MFILPCRLPAAGPPRARVAQGKLVRIRVSAPASAGALAPPVSRLVDGPGNPVRMRVPSVPASVGGGGGGVTATDASVPGVVACASAPLGPGGRTGPVVRSGARSSVNV